MKKRLLFIQFAGDYRDAVRRFSQGGDETYYAQKYSVNFVAELAQKVDEVATLCCLTDQPYNELLENGVRAMGAGFKETVHLHPLILVTSPTASSCFVVNYSNHVSTT